MMSTPQCAWMTRHKPSLEQRHDLSVYVIRQPAFCRYDNAGDMWDVALDITGGHPALIVCILPDVMFNALAIAAGMSNGTVIRPQTLNHGYWTGYWIQSVPMRGGRNQWMNWTPEGQDPQAHEELCRQLAQQREADKAARWRQRRSGGHERAYRTMKHGEDW